MLAVVACAAAAQPPGPAEIGFTLFKTGIVVEVALAPGLRLPFVFDTGLSAHNILAAATAKRLALTPQGKAGFRDSSGARGAAGVVTLPRIEIGPLVLKDPVFAVVPLPAGLRLRPPKPPIAGYLGPPLMQDAVLCIDYGDTVLRRWAHAAFDATGMASVPMPLNHGLPTIRVRIDGIPATLVVDTGSDSGVALFPAFVQAHQLRERYTDLQAGRALSGGGETFRVLKGYAGSVRIGSTTLERVPLLFINQAFDPAWGIDGLAGYALLSRLDPCLDRAGERFLWQASPP